MELLRKVSEFSTWIEDKKEIYVLYIRSILEQCVVWYSFLTEENSEDLKRVQNAAVGEGFENYENALIKVNLESLEIKREELCKNFAKKCVKSENERARSMFPSGEKMHNMNTRKEESFIVDHANKIWFLFKTILFLFKTKIFCC